MFRSVCKFSVAAIVAGLAFAETSVASSAPHKEKCAGTVTVSELESPTVAVQAWEGSGNATHMGAYTEVGSHKADLLTGAIYDGQFTSTAADGSTVYGTYSGSFAINPDGSATYLVTAIWLGGTGRFEGLSGIGTVTSHVSGITPGSTFAFVTDGIWQLP
jgi:hypothetical protein